MVVYPETCNIDNDETYRIYKDFFGGIGRCAIAMSRSFSNVIESVKSISNVIDELCFCIPYTKDGLGIVYKSLSDYFAHDRMYFKEYQAKRIISKKTLFKRKSNRSTLAPIANRGFMGSR